jgi:3-oxoacyl-[acyl-carrier-protein] synthase-3
MAADTAMVEDEITSSIGEEILKSSVIQPIDDRTQHAQLRNSQWFMSVFLRFMLSDGAGAMLLESSPRSGQVSWKIDWTHSMSFANETPLCMKLDNSNRLLTQDVSILSRFLFPKGRKFVDDALVRHNEKLDSYQCVLPHLSSFFFRRKMERILSELSADPEQPVPYWTNLATAGNTGAASIFIMLDHYVKSHRSNHGDRSKLHFASLYLFAQIFWSASNHKSCDKNSENCKYCHSINAASYATKDNFT